MASQHRHTNRNYRPADDEYEPVREAVEAAGYNMNIFIRAVLRRFKANPRRFLALIDRDLKTVASETPSGRPRSETSASDS